MLPIKKWSQPLRVRDVAIDGNRPPGNSGMVYVVTGQPAAERDVKYLGSAHATKATDGAGRIGLLIIAMLGFPVYHSGGICLHKKYSADQIKDFYVLWALIDDDSCPVLAERALRDYYVNHQANSPDFGLCDGGNPRRSSVCKGKCIPQNLGWKQPP